MIADGIMALERGIDSNPNLQPNTKRLYKRAVHSFAAFAGRDSTRWSLASVEAWRDDLVAREFKLQSVRSYLKGLRYATQRLADLHDDPRLDFARKIVIPRIRRRDEERRVALDEQAVHRLYAACAGDSLVDLRDRTLLTFGVRTGARRSSMCSLDLAHVREQNGGTRVTIEIKGGDTHSFFVDAETAQALGALRQALAARGITAGPFFQNMQVARDGTVTCKGRLTSDMLYWALKKRAKKAGLGTVSPHVLRHTFISWARANNVPDWRIREITGQKTNDIIDRYTTDLKAASDPVGAYLPSVSGGAQPVRVAAATGEIAYAIDGVGQFTVTAARRAELEATKPPELVNVDVALFQIVGKLRPWFWLRPQHPATYDVYTRPPTAMAHVQAYEGVCEIAAFRLSGVDRALVPATIRDAYWANETTFQALARAMHRNETGALFDLVVAGAALSAVPGAPPVRRRDGQFVVPPPPERVLWQEIWRSGRPVWPTRPITY